MLYTFIMCDHVIVILIFNTMGISDGSQTSTHTADEHTPRSQVEDALSIGGYQVTKQKA